MAYYAHTNEILKREGIPEGYKKNILGKYNVLVTLFGHLARDIAIR